MCKIWQVLEKKVLIWNISALYYWTVYIRVQRILLFKRKLRTQTFWWVQNLNLRHIYSICMFFIFGTVFARLASKFEKNTNMTSKFFFFQSVKIFFLKCTYMSKSGKSAYFRHVFANNFFGTLKKIFFQWIWNQRAILCFMIPIWIFKENFFFGSYLHIF